MRTGRIPECQVLEGAGLAMTLTMTTARVRRTTWAVRTGTGMGREQRVGRGKGRHLRTGRGKGRRRGKETVKGNVFLNKP